MTIIGTRSETTRNISEGRSLSDEQDDGKNSGDSIATFE